MKAIDVSAVELRASSGEITGVVDQTAGVLETFQTRLDSLGEPWGADELGAAIGEVYRAAYAMVMNCYHSNLDTMDGYAERLSLAADLFDETELDIKAKIRALLSGQALSQ